MREVPGSNPGRALALILSVPTFSDPVFQKYRECYQKTIKSGESIPYQEMSSESRHSVCVGESETAAESWDSLPPYTGNIFIVFILLQVSFEVSNPRFDSDSEMSFA